MKTINPIVPCLIALLVITGCASTKITGREEIVTEKIPRPAQIWVHDYSATPADVPDNSALAGQHSEHNPPQTAEQIKVGRQAGAEIATQLVDRIRGMGMPAAHALPDTIPQINDIVLRGYLITFDEGSAKKRIFIGLGSGASDLKVAAEGFQVTAQGLRKLGGGQTDAAGSKAPGEDLGVLGLIATHNPAGLIVSTTMKVHGEKSGSSKIKGRAKQTANEIADVLKKRFQEQGWVK